MKEIIINSPKHGQHTMLVDDDDYGILVKYNWQIAKGRDTFYARRSVSVKGNKRVTVQAHRFVMNATHKQTIDHMDRDGLNNCKSNLRLATKCENMMNSPKKKHNTTGYKGVVAHGRKFRASLSFSGKRLYLGLYKTAREAAIIYNRKAYELHGEFAYLNPVS